jgi:hypothetical protein
VLTISALNNNALLLNNLSIHTLSTNALGSNHVLLDELSNPSAREVFSFIVSCALPADAVIALTVNGTPYSFPGSLGLAPQWGATNGRCDTACTQWVSACVISRLDYTGAPRLISLRGDTPNLTATPSELSRYTVREATYYGDIFDRLRLYACLSPAQTGIPRVCGPSINGCGVEVLGSCAELCGAPRADGSFPDCQGPHANSAASQNNQHTWKAYNGSVTVFLQP